MKRRGPGGEEGGESFAERWSRRKRGAEAEEAAPLPEDAALTAEGPLAEDERADEEILAELGLPSPETLETPEEVRDFMRAAVPERLRRVALRRLWRLNPMLANLDGLVDYGDDFTDSALVIENLQTAYQVGKGMLRHVEALAAKAAEEANADASGEDKPVAGETDAPGDKADAVNADAPLARIEGAEASADALESVGSEAQVTFLTEDDGGDEDGNSPPRPSRMRFRFEGT